MKKEELTLYEKTKYYISIIFISLILFVCILTLIFGLYYKFYKLKINNRFQLFFKKHIAIGWTSILFTVFTVVIAVGINKYSADCPSYKDNPNHKWFKKLLPLQIMDIIFNLIIIIIAKWWTTFILSNSIEYVNKFKYFGFLNIIGNSSEKDQTTIKEKGGNVTTAFITLLIHKKLRNKIEYISSLF